MKKLMLGMLSFAMAFTLATSVNAEGNGSITIGNSNPSCGDGCVASFSDVTGNSQADSLNSTGDLTVISVQGTDLTEYSMVSKVQDLKVTGVTGNVTVTWSVAGIKVGDEIAVLHYNGSSWEVLAATAGDGTVTCTFDSLSPVAVIKKNTSSKPSTSTDKETEKPATWDDGGPFTTDACGNQYDRWGNVVYQAPGCVNNSVNSNGSYQMVNTSDR